MINIGVEKLKKIMEGIIRKNISVYASSAAFFLFLSLIPAWMLLCAMLPFVPLTEADLMRITVDLAPDALEPVLIAMIHDVYDKSVGVISITLVGTLWSAGKGMLALMTGLNAVRGFEEERNYFIKRIVASVFTVLVLFVIILTLLIMVFGDVLIRLIEERIPGSIQLFSAAINGRPILFFIIITLVLTWLYAYLPAKNSKWKLQLPGAIFAAVGWSVVTYGFSVYVIFFNGFSMYGSLTTIIVLLLWLYMCIWLVLIGAYINKFRIDKAGKID